MFKTKEMPVRREMVTQPPPARVKATPRASGIPSIVSADMSITGNMRSMGDLQIEGTVIGDIEVDKLVIAEGGTVIGHIIANNVRICGSLTGSVRSETVTLAATAVVVGDSYHQLLTIETGALLEGQSRRLTAPASRDMPAPEIEAEAAANEAAGEHDPHNGGAHHAEQHHQEHRAHDEHHEHQH